MSASSPPFFTSNMPTNPSTSPKVLGNILGETTAESDGAMLRDAFYESQSYRELAFGSAFRFVVGRRGAGKSALFQKVATEISKQDRCTVITEHPSEEKAVAFQDALSQLSAEYTEIRHITRLTWRAQILSTAADAIINNYKSVHLSNISFLKIYRDTHRSLFAHLGAARSLDALRTVRRAHPSASARSIPELIAEHFNLGELQNQVTAALAETKRSAIFFYDGLDEGWNPTREATGILGGLAKAASEFKESSQHIRCLLFIRDNMLRALAELDDDYSRNIENNVLRLQWNEETLLSVVALRIKAALGLASEQDIRAWNRFAERGLEGKPGFRRCLQLTLYRPRDLITLLNHAHQDASRDERIRITESDLEAAATRISKTRLADLYKEYERVLPGLPLFGDAFRGMSNISDYASVRARLDDVAKRPHAGPEARDFSLLSSGAEAFNALYSVGFVGVQDRENTTVRFCHDGSNTNVEELASDANVIVHPCYWRALDVKETVSEVLLRVDDEDDVVRTEIAKKDVQALRLRRLGRVVADISKIPEGTVGAHAFEEWVLTTSKYLFSTGLSNIQWHPNGDALQRRDIVGAISSSNGFWKRLSSTYEVSQFTIECKNFREMGHDEFRQAWSYLRGPYGRCLMIVTRSTEEGIDTTERALVMEGYQDSKKLVILMPAFLLARAASKMRSGKENRDEWVDQQLCKRLDTFERTYISASAPRRKK